MNIKLIGCFSLFSFFSFSIYALDAPPPAVEGAAIYYYKHHTFPATAGSELYSAAPGGNFVALQAIDKGDKTILQEWYLMAPNLGGDPYTKTHAEISLKKGNYLDKTELEKVLKAQGNSFNQWTLKGAVDSLYGPIQQKGT